MSFDRPGLPHPGHKSDEPQVAEDLHAEGVEITPDGDLDGLDHPGTISSGPQPTPPRRPPHTPEPTEPVGDPAHPTEVLAESGEPVDDPGHDNPA